MVSVVTNDMVSVLTDDMVSVVTNDMVSVVSNDMVSVVTDDMMSVVTNDMVSVVTNDMVSVLTDDIMFITTNGRMDGGSQMLAVDGTVCVQVLDKGIVRTIECRRRRIFSLYVSKIYRLIGIATNVLRSLSMSTDVNLLIFMES